MTLLRIAALGCALWSLCATVQANRLETLVVYGERSKRLLSETASMAHLVERDALDSPGLEHASQALQAVPGVWFSRGSGQEQLTAIRSPVFTGAGACGAFWVAEDGIPLRASGFCNANEFFDSHYEAAEGIEVFKGPHASMMGGNAQFGAVNVRTPTADAIRPAVALSGSTLGHRRVRGQGAWQDGNHHWGGLLTLTEDDDMRASASVRQQKFSARHSWQGDHWLAADTGITLMHLEQETAGYIEGEHAYKSRAARHANAFPEAYRDADALRAHSRWSRRILDTEWTFTPYVRSNRMDFLMHFVQWQPTEENGHDSVGWQLQWRRYLMQGTEIYLGQDFEQTWGRLRETQSRPSPITPDRIPQGIHYDYRVLARTAGLNAGAYWQATRNLAFDLAARLDYTGYDYRTHATPGSACAPGVTGCRFYRPEDQHNRFVEPSFHLGVVHHWRNRWYWFGKLSNGFRAPQTAELYRAQSPAPLDDMDAEQILAAELGVRGAWRGWFLQTAVYAQQNRDGIVQDSERRYINGVRTDHLGWEYDLSYQWRDWEWALSGQIARHTYGNSPDLLGVTGDIRGNRVDTAPQHLHRVRVQYAFSEHSHLAAQVAHMGAYYLDELNRHKYPGHTLVDLDYRHALSARAQLSVSLQNALNRAYAERADYAFGHYRYFPGLDRRLSLGLRYSL